MATRLLLFFLLLLYSACPVQALPSTLKVNLFSTHKSLGEIFLNGPLRIIEPQKQLLTAGHYLIRTTSGGVVICSQAGKSVLLGPVKKITLVGAGAGADSQVALALGWQALPRRYRGSVSVYYQSAGCLKIVNDVDFRSYLRSCVASETLPSFTAEAIKAQAVLCTTLIERKYRGKAIDDSTAVQSYLGASAEREPVDAAIDSVFGEELCYKGRPIEVFYCSTCGGRTASPRIFGASQKEPAPYLRSIDCNFCSNSPFFQMHKGRVSEGELWRELKIKKPLVQSCGNGRPLMVTADDSGRSISFTGYQFWLLIGQHFGWGLVPSTWYSISNSKPGAVEFISRGCGHGVGMCQWGAQGQAATGRKYKEILYFYFPGTELKPRPRQHFG